MAGAIGQLDMGMIVVRKGSALRSFSWSWALGPAASRVKHW